MDHPTGPSNTTTTFDYTISSKKSFNSGRAQSPARPELSSISLRSMMAGTHGRNYSSATIRIPKRRSSPSSPKLRSLSTRPGQTSQYTLIVFTVCSAYSDIAVTILTRARKSNGSSPAWMTPPTMVSRLWRKRKSSLELSLSSFSPACTFLHA